MVFNALKIQKKALFSMTLNCFFFIIGPKPVLSSWGPNKGGCINIVQSLKKCPNIYVENYDDLCITGEKLHIQSFCLFHTHYSKAVEILIIK